MTHLLNSERRMSHFAWIRRIFIERGTFPKCSKLGEPRGAVYTFAEVRRIVQVADPTVVAEVHRWKREFNATVRDAPI